MTNKHATYSVTKRAKPFAPTPQEVSSAVASYCAVSGLHFDYDTGYDNSNTFLRVSKQVHGLGRQSFGTLRSAFQNKGQGSSSLRKIMLGLLDPWGQDRPTNDP
jgi:hypothetical protein